MRKKPTTSTEPLRDQTREFVEQAAESQPGLIAEFFSFLVHNKKWWLLPIILVLLLLGVLVVLGASPLGPWLYSMF